MSISISVITSGLGKVALVAVFWLTTFEAVAQSRVPIDYWRTDSVKVVRLLSQSPASKDVSTNVMFFARKLRGLPYVAQTLERHSEERLVVNLRQMDCTTYVENVLALAFCALEGETSFEDFCYRLRQLRYRKGKVHYTNRLHYFSLWIRSNVEEGYVEAVERPDSLFTGVMKGTVNWMSTHINNYPMLVKHPEWVDSIRDLEQYTSAHPVRFIPKEKLRDVAALKAVVRTGDVLAIATSRGGLDTSHVGIAVWKKDGLHMLHASLTQRKVVEDGMLLYQYLKRHKSQLGIMVMRLR